MPCKTTRHALSEDSLAHQAELRKQTTLPLFDAWVAASHTRADSRQIHSFETGSIGSESYYAEIGPHAMKMDIPQGGPIGVLSLGTGKIDEAQRLMANLWKVDAVRFTLNGSSGANYVAIASQVREGDHVIIPSYAHVCIQKTLRTVGANTHILQSRRDPGLELDVPPGPDEYLALLRRHPKTRLVVVQQSTYHGALADVSAIVAAIRDFDDSIIIHNDNAWGAQFGHHPELPKRVNTDLESTSPHKMLGTPTGTGMLLSNTGRIDEKRLKLFYEATTSSSPYLPSLASFDFMRAIIETDGVRRMQKVVDAGREIRTAVNDMHGLHALEPRRERNGSSLEFDPARVVISVKGLGISGNQAADHLFNHANVRVEMAERHYILLLLKLSIRPAAVQALLGGLRSLVAQHPVAAVPAHAGSTEITPAVASTNTTFDARAVDRAAGVDVPLTDALDKISKTDVLKFPPATEILGIGNKISPVHLAMLRAHLEAGDTLIGLTASASAKPQADVLAQFTIPVVARPEHFKDAHPV